MGRGRSTLEMVIKDDLSEEMTFKLRLQMGWSLTCRQNSQCRDPEARTSLVCGRKLKKVNATRNGGNFLGKRLKRQEVSITQGHKTMLWSLHFIIQERGQVTGRNLKLFAISALSPYFALLLLRHCHFAAQ